ncbi:MAG: hypothetical protein WCA13_02340 [Terriglobales bacterium]
MNIVTKSIRDRREFFRWLARESLVAFDELRGRPHLRLRDLNELPDAQMLASKPGILPEVEIIVEDCSILARLPQQADAVTLFSRDSIELAIFNRFNGTCTLAEAAESVGAESGTEPEEVLTATRILFLRMVALGVCAPVNALSDSDDGQQNRVESQEKQDDAYDRTSLHRR